MTVPFIWQRKKPEDFIVKEISDIPLEENGNFYIYLLAKCGISTKELAKELKFSYAGLKDAFALTFQKVCFDSFQGDFVRKELEGGKWFILKFLGKAKRKLKIGQLKGNKFAVNVSGFPYELKSSFINYYDVQRIANNYERGKRIILAVLEGKKKRLKWLENFLIDAYLSYLWNKSLELYLKELTDGIYIEEKGEKFFIPSQIDEEKLPKFWTILGYKKKLLHSEPYYEKVLKEEGFELKEFISILKLMKIKGDYRMTYVRVRELREVAGRIFFFLPKGAYGTMYLKHIQAEMG